MIKGRTQHIRTFRQIALLLNFITVYRVEVKQLGDPRKNNQQLIIISQTLSGFSFSVVNALEITLGIFYYFLTLIERE